VIRRLPLAPTLLLAAALTAACGSDPPTTPSTPVVRVTAIQPTSGSTFGGTTVTISGENFAVGASVTVGGVAATSVTILSSTTLTAITPARAAGPADVAVAVGGRQATLPGAFQFVTPAIGPNSPPVVQPLRAQGSRPNQPAQMADLGEAISVSTIVTDSESTTAQLTFEWAATVGTIEGTGQSVIFRAPAGLAQTPADANVTLTVTEKYLEAGPTGLPIEREHRVAQSASIRVHDSLKEVAEMGRQFLLMFSDSSIPAEAVVKDFTDLCAGKEFEYDDVVDDRLEFQILSSFVGAASPVTVNFGSACVIENRFRPADACAYYPVRWVSRSKLTGATGFTEGTDQVTAVYRQRRWWLCDSDYIASNSGPAGWKFRQRRIR
jgi:hypothetical protein